MPVLDDHILTLGAYYSAEDLNDTTTNRISDRSTVDRWQYALYAEDEWQITDTFALTGGIRMDRDQKAGQHWSPRLYRSEEHTSELHSLMRISYAVFCLKKKKKKKQI